MERVYYISAVLILILVLGISDVPAKRFEEIGPPTIIILDSKDLNTMKDNVKYIESQGGHIVHIYPPNVLIGYIPDKILASLAVRKNINKVTRDLLDPANFNNYGRLAVAAVMAWNNNFKGMAKFNGLEPPAGAPNGSPLSNDVFIRPKPQLAPMLAPPSGASFSDTSEYMLGKIAVGIILTESNGSIDPSTEDWTTTEENEVISEIQSGLNWWANIANRTIGAKLTFVYDIHLKVPTKYEPINRPQSDQGLWITDAMSFLGYNSSSSYITNADYYCNAIRDSYNTDWAYITFVADSSNDADGKFADGRYFAYAYLGGPFLQMTYKNNGWGISRMDQVLAHETGHIFYALDEYAGSNSSKTATSGYLNVPNTNYNSGIDCIMNNNNVSIEPCQYTLGHVGLRDTDGDGIPDILDVPPDTTLTPYSPDPTTNNTPTYNGSAKVVPLVNMNPYGLKHNITLNKIVNVQYRIDGGAWMNAVPTDGAFDSAFEYFTFTTFALSSGIHTIEVRAIDSSGNIETSYASDQLTIENYTTMQQSQPPVLSDFAINSGSASTESQVITLNHTATNNPTEYMASEKSDFSGAIWQAYVSNPSFTLSSGYGTKTVYLKLRNVGGESNVQSDTIQYIQVKPSLISFMINNGASAVTNRTVTLNNIADSNPKYYMASEDISFVNANWQTYSSAPKFTLSKGYGTKTVYLKVKNDAGESNVTSDTIDYVKSLASGVALAPKDNLSLQNYPNPFNPDTWIPYKLNMDSEVVIKIYSEDGLLIRTLNQGFRKAGYYIDRNKAGYWDGKNETGEIVSSGIYFYIIQAGDSIIKKKMLINK
jgi:hypothetical protein